MKLGKQLEILRELLKLAGEHRKSAATLERAARRLARAWDLEARGTKRAPKLPFGKDEGAAT